VESVGLREMSDNGEGALSVPPLPLSHSVIKVQNEKKHHQIIAQ